MAIDIFILKYFLPRTGEYFRNNNRKGIDIIMSKYVEIKMRAYYNDANGKIQLITKDKRFRGKPFQITLSRESESVESLFNVLEDNKVITDESAINKLPKEIYLDINKIKSQKFVQESDRAKSYINNKEDPRLVFSIGEDYNGDALKIYLRHSPTTLISGIAGSGKTQLLRSIAKQAMHHSNSQLFIISGGLSDDFDDIGLRYGSDHIAKGLNEIFEMCHNLERILEDRLNILERYGLVSWLDHHDISPIFFLVDELASFLRSDEKATYDVLSDTKMDYCHQILDLLAKIGKTVGIYAFYATQRPDVALIPGKMKANMGRRILMGKSNEVLAHMTLGKKPETSDMLRENRGRGIIKLFDNKEILFQAYHIPYLPIVDS